MNSVFLDMLHWRAITALCVVSSVVLNFQHHAKSLKWVVSLCFQVQPYLCIWRLVNLCRPPLFRFRFPPISPVETDAIIYPAPVPIPKCRFHSPRQLSRFQHLRTTKVQEMDSDLIPFPPGLLP